MEPYKHILVAVDLSGDASQVLQKGADLASRYHARLSIMHVVEPVILDSGYELMPSLPLDIDSKLMERAREYLSKLVEQLGLKDVVQQVETGSIKNEIFKFVEEHAVDLIVIGTHGRHGVGLLLGSTASAILHGTPCDVHAVRIRGKNP